MDKQELALEVIGRLKKNTRMRDARWIMTMHGSCWSVYVWQHSARMRESM